MLSPASPAPGARGPVPRSVLSDETYLAIRAMLLEHEIRPGQRINIDSIARELNVSQTPVREALARLEADDLVIKQPLRGYSATELLTEAQVEDLFRFRRLVEPWLAGRAAEVHSADDAEELQAEVERGWQALDLDVSETYSAYAAHDVRFHDAIARMSRSEFVRDAFTRVHCQLHLYRINHASRASIREAEGPEYVDLQFSSSNPDGKGMQTMREHSLIANAIVAGQTNAAAAHMLDHIVSSRRRLPNLPSWTAD